MRLIVAVLLLLNACNEGEQGRTAKSDEATWLMACEEQAEDCATYLVDPFPLSADVVGDEKWRALSGRTITPARFLFEPNNGVIDLPLLDRNFSSFRGHFSKFIVEKHAMLDSTLIAPRKAFRKITGCWPFSKFTVVDVNADYSETFYVTPTGRVGSGEEEYECTKKGIDWRKEVELNGCEFSLGQLYVYGESLYHLRLTPNEPVSEKSIGLERFFIITGSEERRGLETVTAANYTEDIEIRKYPSGTCSNIESSTPEWAAWDARSRKKIQYPEFPASIYRGK